MCKSTSKYKEIREKPPFGTCSMANSVPAKTNTSNRSITLTVFVNYGKLHKESILLQSLWVDASFL